MERVALDDLEPEPSSGDAARRGLSDPLDTTDVAINHYRLDPGDRSAGLHAHGDQEEGFVVLRGEAAVETLDGEVAVGPSAAIRFEPGEFHSGLLAREDAVTAIAIGAPRDSQEVRIPLPCPACGHRYRRPGLADGGETPVLRCPDCGEEMETPCPECGSDGMRAELAAAGDSAAGVCGDCGAEAG